MIIRPYGSEKFDKPGFETFYEAVKICAGLDLVTPCMITTPLNMKESP